MIQISETQEYVINTYINTLKQYPLDTNFYTAGKVLEEVLKMIKGQPYNNFKKEELKTTFDVIKEIRKKNVETKEEKDNIDNFVESLKIIIDYNWEMMSQNKGFEVK